MLAAMEHNGGALKFASVELLADREFVLAAVRQDYRALMYASAELRADRAFMLAALEESGERRWSLPRPSCGAIARSCSPL